MPTQTVSVKKSTFVTSIVQAARVAATGSFLESYKCLFFEPNIVRATDGEVSVAVRCPGATGPFLVRTEALAKLAAMLPGEANEDVQLTIDGRRLRVEIAGHRSSYPLLNDEAFPGMTIRGHAWAAVESDQFVTNLGLVAAARSDNKSNPLFCGVAVQGGHLYATNREVMATAASGLPDDFNLVLPGKAVERIMQFGSPTKIAKDATHAYFVFGDALLATVLVAGAFPDLASYCVTDGRPGPVELPTVELGLALARASVMGGKGGNATTVTLTFEADKLTLTAEGDHGDVDDIVALDAGPLAGMSFSVDPTYLRTALSNTTRLWGPGGNAHAASSTSVVLEGAESLWLISLKTKE